MQVPSGDEEALPDSRVVRMQLHGLTGGRGVTAAGAPRRLVGEKANRLYFIGTDTIEYIESAGNYVEMHVGDDCYIARSTTKHLAAVLAHAGFVRIHRSLLVNLNTVAYAERIGGGAFSFTLRNGRRLVSSPTYRAGILEEIRYGPASAT